MTPEQLRASILQYAMEGKLVKQDPNDELASELLKKIEKKRAALTKEGQIKKSKKLPVITDEEKLFDIPDSWEWARVGTLFSVNDRNKADDTLIAGFLPMKNIDDGYSNTYAVNDRKWKDIKSGYTHIRQGDIVVAKITPCFQNRKSCVITELPNGIGAATTEVYALNPIIPEFSKLYIYFFKSQLFIQEGMKKFTGSAGQQRVPRKFVENFAMPLPPLEEQKRIVAKIEKLMPLVDEYAESYNRLQKIDNEFEDKLKQSVLQYAMKGKLVKQDPNDEPASELIKKIENEKAELIKEGKINKSKKLPEITDDEKPFDIPDSWEWVRVGNIIRLYNGKAFKPSDWSTKGLPIVRIQNLNNADAPYHYYDGQVEERFYLKGGELLFSWSGTPGTSFGAHIWKEEKAVLNQHIFKLLFDLTNLDKSFLAEALNFRVLSLINEAHGSAGLQHITKKVFEKTVIPIPPLEEQQRIAAKIKKMQSSISRLSK
ncbi:restriction endonuclease subunit S [Lactobacillus amylovorus]|uniref:restriction endonuclease subunit S n=1 Tax=Lactobacillus amylovorus TaxID=1604 RepID=UPI000E4D1280|nr:restriction endonuclease subunit S [Lactobacillus amylovorus]RGW87491.1 restriction endonuclease subunit S [Lactobacillus amylovorus]